MGVREGICRGVERRSTVLVARSFSSAFFRCNRQTASPCLARDAGESILEFDWFLASLRQTASPCRVRAAGECSLEFDCFRASRRQTASQYWVRYAWERGPNSMGLLRGASVVLQGVRLSAFACAITPAPRSNRLHEHRRRVAVEVDDDGIDAGDGLVQD